MASIDKKYHDLLLVILRDGFEYEDPNRKGVKRLQIPSYTLAHNFDEGFPILTTKKSFFKGAIGELLVFLSGSTDLKDLHSKGIHFWDQDAFNFYKKRNNQGTLSSFTEGIEKFNHIAGDLGKIYPYQMRKWGGDLDQISKLIHTLKTNPMATKKTVTMWNPAQTTEACLTPCHWSFEALVEPVPFSERCCGRCIDGLDECSPSKEKYSLTIKWHQHSVDTFLGLPINIMYYSLMCYILAEISGMVPKGVIGDLSNIHIYESHLPAVKKQLENDISRFANCNLVINETARHVLSRDKSIDEKLSFLDVLDFTLDNYESYPTIKAKMLAYDE